MDTTSGMQAAYAAMIIYRGRYAAKQWLFRYLGDHGADGICGPSTLLGALTDAGLPAIGHVVGNHDMAPLYARCRAERFVTLGRFKHGTGPMDNVWGIMYIKPCQCDGLLMLYGRHGGPTPAVPHREVYLGEAVTICRSGVVSYRALQPLPQFHTP